MMKQQGNHLRFRRFAKEVIENTPIVRLVVLLLVLWLGFSAAIFLAEDGAEDSQLATYGDALYWSVAAFSTAGIADTPATGAAKMIGGLWIVIGSLLFFGTIVATVTAYFMRPMQRPHKQIIETIEYNLEQLEELDLHELDLLKDTIDTLILHVERIKTYQLRLEEREDD